jgi:hypothetical protein
MALFPVVPMLLKQVHKTAMQTRAKKSARRQGEGGTLMTSIYILQQFEHSVPYNRFSVYTPRGFQSFACHLGFRPPTRNFWAILATLWLKYRLPLAMARIATRKADRNIMLQHVSSCPHIEGNLNVCGGSVNREHQHERLAAEVMDLPRHLHSIGSGRQSL